MKGQVFNRPTEDSLIIVPCYLDNDPLSLAIDTGASHTTIDITTLLIAGYEMTDAASIEKIETASGVIDGYSFIIDELCSLGLSRRNFKVCL